MNFISYNIPMIITSMLLNLFFSFCYIKFVLSFPFEKSGTDLRHKKAFQTLLRSWYQKTAVNFQS